MNYTLNPIISITFINWNEAKKILIIDLSKPGTQQIHQRHVSKVRVALIVQLKKLLIDQINGVEQQLLFP